MGASTDPKRERRRFLALAAIAAVSLAVIAALNVEKRSAVVELALTLDRVELTAVPRAAALATFSLLDQEAQRIELRGGDRIEALLADRGPTALRLAEGGGAQVAAAGPFRAELKGHGPTRLAVSAGRDRAGNRLVRIEAGAGAAGWSVHVPAVPELSLKLRDAELLGPGNRAAGALEPAVYPIPEDAPDLLIRSRTRGGELGFVLPPEEGSATLLRVVNPATGEVTGPQRLAFASAEPRSIVWKERLVLLDPVAAAAGPAPVLLPDLKVRDLRFFRIDRQEPVSYLLAGEVRFPSGEKPAVKLEARQLLTVESTAPFTLRSLNLEKGRLQLVATGQATSVRLGPTEDLGRELLPSLFLWIYRHELRTLVYSAIVSILGASLALFKTLDLFKGTPSEGGKS